MTSNYLEIHGVLLYLLYLLCLLQPPRRIPLLSQSEQSREQVFFFFFSISSPSPSPSPSPSFFFFFLLFSSAKNSLQVKEMESVMACCVCNGKMREPIKTLPCLHSACLQCLKSYAAKSLRDHHDQEADSSCNAAITISMEMEEED